jgi:type I restriction enzyme, S subunit
MAGKYQAYREYKDSEIEWLDKVPIHWTRAPIKYMALEKESLFLDGDWIESNDLSTEGIRYITTGNVGEGGYKEQGEGYITNEKFHQIGCTEVFEGDVLISRLNNPIGRACIVPDLNSRIVTSVDNVIFRPDKRFSKKFLVYLFSSNEYFTHTSNISRGATMQRISRGLLGNIRVPFPLVEEQEQIANFLDHETAKIDTLIEKQQQLIKLLKEKRQAVISHAVTKGLNPNTPMRDSGVEWLGEVPGHWVKKIKLLNVAESNRGSFVNGPFGSDLLADELRDEGVPVVYIRDIKRTGYKRKSTVCVTPEKARQLDVCKVQSGDVIISKVGDPPGDTCVYPEGEPNAIITQDVIRIRVDRTVANPLYLVMLLNSDFGQMIMNDISVEGTRKRVSLGDFKATKFVLPPLDEQDDIVDYVNGQCMKMDTLIERSENGVVLIRERRTALISAAVTGKIDVRTWKAPEQSQANKNVAA